MTMQGAIIAAGRGERLRSTRDDLPKPLVELGGEAMLVRQARALLAAGASSVIAIINSETARAAERTNFVTPPGVRIVVKDTASSMETLLTLGDWLAPGWFVAATVDSIVPAPELARFVTEARRIIERRSDEEVAGVLGVTRWRGDRKPLFADVSKEGLITRLGSDEASSVTAGLYLLHTRIFAMAGEARRAGLDALRRFLSMLIDHQMKLYAVEVAGAIDVDEQSDLEAARRAIRSIR
jgi:NDP-sugar pyrophosphorylase family protein